MKLKSRYVLVAILMWVVVGLLGGCAAFSDFTSTTKGSLLGNSYTIYQYDNLGSQTLQLKGSHIAVAPYEPEVKEDGSLELTSVLSITIDGSQILAVGNTLIFEEVGIDKLAGFDEIVEFANVYSQSGLHFIPFDKFVNTIKNSMGKGRLVLVYSQLGDPISAYQGDSVYVTIPNNLPKMTRLNIDGKSLYLHRVNYTIIDIELLN